LAPECSDDLKSRSAHGCHLYLLSHYAGIPQRPHAHEQQRSTSSETLNLLSADYQTFHIHHAGRALYTLIAPPTSPGSEPIVRRIVMGSDPSKGEVTQLFVPGGWWKASEMPKDDLLLLDNSHAEGLEERLGCLISEVVVPGWTPEQHQFLTEEKVCSRPLFA